MELTKKLKLKDIPHFNIHSNRFVLFDKNGRRLNEWQIEKHIKNYLELKVIEAKEGGYQDHTYFVGFKTMHLKLDFISDDKKIYSSI